MKPVWLSESAVLAMHEELLAEHGGASGAVNMGQLKATLACPQQKLDYEDPDIIDLAASYGFGFARNHCFTDANKRISLVAIDVFLQINGHELVASEIDAVATMIQLAAGEISESELAVWIRVNSTP